MAPWFMLPCLTVLFLMSTLGIVECKADSLQSGESMYGFSHHIINKRDVHCYQKLGCFDTGGVFFDRTHRPINLPPASRASIGTSFYLHTRRTRRTLRGQVLRAGQRRRLARSKFQSERPTKMIIHGFLENRLMDWVKSMVQELLVQDDYNVIVVDWSAGASIPYMQATANSRVVGAEIALLINFIQNQTGAIPADFHLIGFSLGAHVAGYAGERVSGLGRISGLDPADPYFQGMPSEVRLDPTDAQFVDVLHTDAAHIANVMLLNGGFGLEQPVGHVDFYPNGGKEQPGCEQPIVQSFRRDGIMEGGTRLLRMFQRTVDGGVTPKNLFRNVFEILQDEETRELVACNHHRALNLYIESINSDCPFEAFSCENVQDFKEGSCQSCGADGGECGFMGFKADKRKPPEGVTNRRLYLSTRDTKPFCLHHINVLVRLANISRSDMKGQLWVKLIGTQRSSEPTAFADQDTNFEAGKMYSVLVGTSMPLGNIQQVEFWWECSAPWWNPLHWCWARSALINLDTVQVHSTQAQQQLNVCVESADILPDEKVILDQC